MKRALGMLAASMLVVVGCGDKAAPTAPSFAPVVTSASSTDKYYSQGWVVNGSNFNVDSIDPTVTLESRGRMVALTVMERSLDVSRIGVSLEDPAEAGVYNLCVENTHGKGCSSFTVDVKENR